MACFPIRSALVAVAAAFSAPFLFAAPVKAEPQVYVYTNLYDYSFEDASLDDCISNAIQALNENKLGNGIEFDTYGDGSVKEVTGYSKGYLHTASITCDKESGLSYIGFAGYSSDSDATFEWYQRLSDFGW